MSKPIATHLKLIPLLNDLSIHDGNTLGKQLNLSRAAVWKGIKKLIQYGIPITSIPAQGYLLQTPISLLDKAQLSADLSKNMTLHLFESIPSTNDFLKKSTHTDNKHIEICLSEHQTHGHGRFQRTWHSPFAENIYLSIKYPFQGDISQLSGLSSAMALATLRTISPYLPSSKHLTVKWPNDLYYQNKKISGSLIEMRGESHGLCHIIVGIGLNVNMTCDPFENINQDWTSIKNITRQTMDRTGIAKQLIHSVLDSIDQFSIDGLKPLLKEWRRADHLKNKNIKIQNNQKTFTGLYRGIDQHGRLKLEKNTGEHIMIAAGDASIVS